MVLPMTPKPSCEILVVLFSWQLTKLVQLAMPCLTVLVVDKGAEVQARPRQPFTSLRGALPDLHPFDTIDLLPFQHLSR